MAKPTAYRRRYQLDMYQHLVYMAAALRWWHVVASCYIKTIDPTARQPNVYLRGTVPWTVRAMPAALAFGSLDIGVPGPAVVLLGCVVTSDLMPSAAGSGGRGL